MQPRLAKALKRHAATADRKVSGYAMYNLHVRFKDGATRFAVAQHLELPHTLPGLSPAVVRESVAQR
eukprot:6198263-Pleurochrysis_carterae.AAC.1